MNNTIYPGSQEYIQEVMKRHKEGGSLWIVERTDTHEFYAPSMELSVHTFGKGYNKRHCQWYDTINLFVLSAAYLSKADYELCGWQLDVKRGCSNCGYGGDPIECNEHVFENGIEKK